MRRIWSGEAPQPDLGSVGPKPAHPGSPLILLGGIIPHGETGGMVGRQLHRRCRPGPTGNGTVARARDANLAHGRQEGPRLAGGIYYALGPDAEEQVRVYIHDYFAYAPGDMVETILSAVPTRKGAVREVISWSRAIGVDEPMFWPASSNFECLERLAQMV